jgi:hypothetical protein
MKGKPPIVVRLVIVAAAWAAIGTLLFFVQRDLERRPDAGIRGRKEVFGRRR